MFVNLDSIASADCNLGGDSNSLVLSWCDIITQNLFGEYFITLRGNISPYASENVGIPAELIIYSVGEGYSPLRTILPNQKIHINDLGLVNATWFIMGIENLNAYAGDTIITLTLPTTVKYNNLTSHLYSGFNFLNSPLCASPFDNINTNDDDNSFKSCTVVKYDREESSCFIEYSSCEMYEQKFLYIYVTNVIPKSSIVVTQRDPYIKYLTFYNLTKAEDQQKQQETSQNWFGSMSKSNEGVFIEESDDDEDDYPDLVSFEIDTEGSVSLSNSEHFYIDLVGDHIVKKKLYLTVILIPKSEYEELTISYSPFQVPNTNCSVISCSIEHHSQKTQQNCTIQIDYCTFADYPGFYLSVSGKSKKLTTTNEIITINDDYNNYYNSNITYVEIHDQSIVDYQLIVKATIKPKILSAFNKTCATATSDDYIWFSIDPNYISSMNNTPIIHSFKIEVNDKVLPIEIYLDSESIASENCYDTSLICYTNEVCWISWDCAYSNDISIAIKTLISKDDKGKENNSPFSIEWQPEITTFLNIELNTLISFPQCCSFNKYHNIGQYFILNTTNINNDDDDSYFYIQFNSFDVDTELYLNINDLAGDDCFLQHCTGSCSFIQGCSLSGDSIYFHVTSTLYPYTLFVQLIPLQTNPLQIFDPITNFVDKENPLQIYYLDLTNIKSSYPSRLLIHINGISNGEILTWISQNNYGDASCSIAKQKIISSSLLDNNYENVVDHNKYHDIYISPFDDNNFTEEDNDTSYDYFTFIFKEDCFHISGFVYYISIEWKNSFNQCDPIVFNLLASFESNIENPPVELKNNTQIYKPIRTNEEDYYYINISNTPLPPDSVLQIIVSGIKDRLVTAKIQQTYNNNSKNHEKLRVNFDHDLFPSLTCYSSGMEEDEIYLLSIYLQEESTIYIRVLGLEKTNKQGTKENYFISARLINSIPLLINEKAFVNISLPKQSSETPEYSKHYFAVHNISKFDDTQSLSVSLNVIDGTSVDISIYVILLDQNFYKELLQFTCLSGDCVIPFTQIYSIPNHYSLEFYEIVITIPYSSISVAVWEGFQGNCIPLNSSLCGDVSILKFGDIFAYENQVIDFYNDLYEKFFCPSGCSCSNIKQSCNESLIDFACSSILPICNNVTGFQQPLCRSLCTNVEDSCLLSWLDAGLPRYDCASNFYSSCNTSDLNPFTHSNQESYSTYNPPDIYSSDFDFSVGNLPTGAIVAITLACFLCLILFLATGYAVVQYIEKKQLKIKEIEEADEQLLYLEDEDDFVNYSINNDPPNMDLDEEDEKEDEDEDE